MSGRQPLPGPTATQREVRGVFGARPEVAAQRRGRVPCTSPPQQVLPLLRLGRGQVKLEVILRKHGRSLDADEADSESTEVQLEHPAQAAADGSASSASAAAVGRSAVDHCCRAQGFSARDEDIVAKHAIGDPLIAVVTFGAVVVGDAREV